jgi:uncharacterized membrane protein YhaH (DUF805 family)
MSWYLQVLSKYATFTGRARRREYWVFSLLSIVIMIALLVVDVMFGMMDTEAGIGLLSGLYTLAVFVPSLAVGVRRLHDTGRSGRWMLLLLVPLVGSLWLLVLMLLDGERSSNQFGPDPKALSY